MHVYDGRSSFSCSGIYEEVYGGRYPGYQYLYVPVHKACGRVCVCWRLKKRGGKYSNKSQKSVQNRVSL